MDAQTAPTAVPLDKLFVYGSLDNPYHVQLLIGRKLPTQKAILYGYRRIHPKSGYPFAIPWSGSKIEGSLLCEMTPEILQKFDDYEAVGELYTREIVTTHIVADQPVQAYVYIGIPETLKPYFKKGIGMRDRIEEFIEKSVNTHLAQKATRYLRYDQDQQGLPLQVTKELLSEETHTLIREYFREAGLPVFIIKHELENADIPKLDWLKYDRNAATYADEYLKLAVKFMVFNQIEEHFRHDFRPYVKVSDEYYMHTVSALMALKLLVTNYRHLELAMFEINVDRYDPGLSYIDYAVAAIFIARELYTDQQAKETVEWVRENRRMGAIPLGAELEFSNIGGRAIGAREGEDPKFDSFYYFYDFDLMRRGWKLGAHVDDHGFLTTTHTRTRGFLELAFGRYKLLGDVSKPATDDPWILAQMIDLAMRYLAIRPHSLHITMQTPQQRPFQKLENPEYLLCLLLLGGDLRLDKQGKLREMRIFDQEIIRDAVNVHFSRLNRHHKTPADDHSGAVVEFQFSRLYFDYDYQPLIMALKGFQLGLNPYPLKEMKGCPYETYHHELEAFLIQWASNPTPVSAATLTRFMDILEEGLMYETQLAVSPKYVKYAQRMLGRIEEQLQHRNQRIQKYYAYI